MKRFLICAFICCLSINFFFTSTLAKTMWDQYWGKEGYSVELTQGDLDEIEQLWKEIDVLSQGSGIRETAEMYTLEDEYNDYLETNKVPFEQYYEDIGTYIWIPGLPDDQSISKYQAFCISIKALCDQYQQEPNDFIHYYPRFSYEISDPENPKWNILFIRYDDNNANISYKTQINAYTGNIIGMQKRQSVG